MKLLRGLRQATDYALCRSPAAPLLRFRSRHHLRVLAYHRIADPVRFEQHLAFLALNYHVISPTQFLTALTTGETPGPGSVLITFDDGDRSVADVALPILKRMRLPAVTFVIAALLDSDQPPWWTEVLELTRCGGRVRGIESQDPRGLVSLLKRLSNDKRLQALEDLRSSAAHAAGPFRNLRSSELSGLEAQGIAVGNHTLSHPCLDRCDAEELQREIVEAHNVLTKALGEPPNLFAFPNGNRDPRALPWLQTLGYQAAFSFDHGIQRLPCDNRFAVSRLRVDASASIDRLRTIVGGLHPALHHALGRL